MLFLIFIPIVVSVIVYTFPNLAFGDYLFNNIVYIFFSTLILFYFVIARINYYTLKIDSYVIDIKIYRTVLSLFNPKDYIDISHDMFVGFSFFNRSFSFNKTLMIKIKSDSGKTIVKRFNLSFLSEREELRISKILEKIIAKNS
jgi:hypothetical protein